MSASKTAIVLPIYVSNVDRFKNFQFVISRLSINTPNSHIYVIEQKNNLKLVESEVLKYKNITHIKVDLGGVFNKSKLINCISKSITEKYMWICDCDFYTNFSPIDNFLSNTHFDLVKPFSKILFLNKKQSDVCIKHKFIRAHGNFSTNTKLGKFSFAVKTELFNEVGGFNENFVGWGFQDLDIINRVQLQFPTTHTIKQPAVHLYHPIANTETYDDNKKLYYHNT